MNLIERKVLELIGENVDSPDVFTDDDVGMAPIRDSVNDAIQEIVMLTGGYKRQYYLPLREGIGMYRIRLSGDLGWITDMWSTNLKLRLEQTDLTRLASYDPRWMVTSGNPRSYYQFGREIMGVHPKPSGSSDVMEITLVEIPSAYTTDRDRIKLRDSFHYACVYYAVAEFWASRGDSQEAQKHMKMYMDSLGLKEDFQRQQDATRGFNTRKEPWVKVTE